MSLTRLQGVSRAAVQGSERPGASMGIKDQDVESGQSLLGAEAKVPRPQDEATWKFFHALFFVIGGFTFVCGTACFYFPSWEDGAFASALFYTIGSCGFLAVDTQEALTFTRESVSLRTNITCSWVGSLLYVVGSIGFFPAVYAWSDQIGIQGFIWGSFCIGASQLWKTHRIGSDKNGFSTKVITGSVENITATGVELSAGLGGWCFFVGTLIYWHGPQDGVTYQEVLAIWMMGSLLFAMGGCFLAYRHLNGM